MEYKSIGGEKILIVDDVETNRLVLEEIIKDMGCVPILAEGGKQAFELAKAQSPQLILTDISMPEMDGYELCRILKQHKSLKEIPIVFISAFDDPMDIVEGFILGGEDYITKPFIPEVVQARVGVQLRLYEAKKELLEINRRLQISVTEQLKQMELEKKNILYALANIALQNSNYENDYMDRLRRNCRIMAQGMQLSPLFEDKISDTYIDTIELATPLCDIGNIGVPIDILRKKTDLNDEELAMMQQHTSIGARLLGDLYVNNDYNEFISTAIEIAHFHHENWDGSGYPKGLKENEIPLAPQIVAVMERYTNLTEKDAHSREEALAIMQDEAGSKFNPVIFGICQKISRQLC
ncbi:MAG: response regulator [Blautia sp.]|nr:response regulator [Lachnoclostridium sp.]MCM1212064.1 response regulator [Blautia sp.]